MKAPSALALATSAQVLKPSIWRGLSHSLAFWAWASPDQPMAHKAIPTTANSLMTSSLIDLVATLKGRTSQFNRCVVSV